MVQKVRIYQLATVVKNTMRENKPALPPAVDEIVWRISVPAEETPVSSAGNWRFLSRET
jgi:hypothetical protein